MMKRLLATAVFAAVLASPAAAQLKLPHLFSDHAVLQRDRPLHIWGWAHAGATVAVALHDQRATAIADRLGRWEVWLKPAAAGGPYVLTVDGGATEGTLRVEDVMLGDVWFASGQSNMEFPLKGFDGAPLKNAAAEIAAATNPRIRLLRIAHKASTLPLRDIDATWTTTTPATAIDFSAIGYFFAREIAAREHVTVGVIDSTWGGTPADSWVSTDAFATDTALAPAIDARARFQQDQTDADLALVAEAREDAAIRATGGTPPSHPWHPPEEAYRPSSLYNAMVAPFTGYGIKGVIWYQGETNSNVARAPYYADLFRGLITDWRHNFAQGAFPFLYAQISSFNSPAEEWGLVRDAQRRALGLAGTAMAVTTDVGDPGNVHPADKQTVAARLALAARSVAYGERVAYEGPLFRQASGEPGGMRIWFDHAAGLTSRGAPVTGFEIAGSDRSFVAATATIDGDTVVVAGPVRQPRYVRYNWANVVPGSLYNAAGLPMSTFTSEERIQGHMAYP
ncbi:sialate O-acetylesterase [Sphingomonas sp. CD22]|uniref:sialate O-acetylesterase n=1 Tax=Sphingomonas sp. CD22 TaxID=3100214 RepID=UPI002ADF040B|nr:sialate O-acetylesterase [Sphingomonas sp. CD22]MEA1086086.1 sialate O-acetylesterase [Sphingomonas sp. CD22]